MCACVCVCEFICMYIYTHTHICNVQICVKFGSVSTEKSRKISIYYLPISLLGDLCNYFFLTVNRQLQVLAPEPRGEQRPQPQPSPLAAGETLRLNMKAGEGPEQPAG